MWRTLRKLCCFPLLWPLYFVASFFKNYNLRIVNYIIRLYNNIMGVHRELPERTWPYEDHLIEEQGEKKIIYSLNAIHLESKLSRKFRRSKNND